LEDFAVYVTPSASQLKKKSLGEYKILFLHCSNLQFEVPIGFENCNIDRAITKMT
jgi:hypothetical protein